jgi:hypothetical protein
LKNWENKGKGEWGEESKREGQYDQCTIFACVKHHDVCKLINTNKMHIKNKIHHFSTKKKLPGMQILKM